MRSHNLRSRRRSLRGWSFVISRYDVSYYHIPPGALPDLDLMLCARFTKRVTSHFNYNNHSRYRLLCCKPQGCKADREQASGHLVHQPHSTALCWLVCRRAAVHFFLNGPLLEHCRAQHPAGALQMPQVMMVGPALGLLLRNSPAQSHWAPSLRIQMCFMMSMHSSALSLSCLYIGW